jgi:CheY-like chemotaxis protein
MKSAVNLPRIFIIDGNGADCHFISQSLLRAGYRADFSTDGQNGLANILQNPPQCLIINAILPGRSGYAICRHIRTIYSHDALPIILMSTTNTSLDQNYSFRVGANHRLLKPFTENELLQAVQKVLPAFFSVTQTAQMPSSISQPVAPKAALPPSVSALIPYRQTEADMTLQDNAFVRSSIITDQQQRRLYELIDDRKTIQNLAELIRLDLQSTLRLLKILWKQQHIAFRDAKGRIFKDASILDDAN